MGCQKITETIEKGNIAQNTVSERLAIRLHLSICKNCRKYSRDSRILDRMLRHSLKKIPDYSFSAAEKAVIINKLR